MTWLDDNAAWLARAAERWTPRRVEPLRIRAWLRGPVCWDGRDTLQLEGALQHAAIRRETGRNPTEVFQGCAREESAVAPLVIPIADVEIDGHRIACASAAFPYPLAAEGTRNRNKRARFDVLGLGKVTISGGAFKSLRIPVGVLHVPLLDFFVRGDRELLLDLLRDVSGLGRDSARGLGTVDGWQVGPDHADRSLAFQGRPMRPLPVAYDGSELDVRSFVASSYEERDATLRAPYWRDWMRVPAVVPVVPTASEASWWADVVREEATTT